MEGAEATGLAEAVLKGMESSTPEPGDGSGFDFAADELFAAAKSDDKGAFRRALKSLLDIDRARS